MSPLTIALLCTGLLLLVIILWVIVSHNGFVRLRNLVQEAWRQIDVELNRRHDLIPNLLETVRGYMSYEQSTLQAVVEARRLAEAPAANLAQRARNEDALSGALSRLIALSENYPTLRADSSFLQLQQELTNTEDRIAAGRRFYNSNVRDLNTKCEKFPSLIIASIFHFRHAEYFEVHDEASRAVPQVSFGGQPQSNVSLAMSRVYNGGFSSLPLASDLVSLRLAMVTLPAACAGATKPISGKSVASRTAMTAGARRRPEMTLEVTVFLSYA